MDEEKKKLSRTMVNFNGEGVVLSASDIRSIEKTQKYVEKSYPHIEYGISINRNMDQSQQVSKTNVDLWYMKEKKRDDVWNNLLQILEDEGVNFLNI